MNKYGICLDPNKTYTILDDIGKQFLDHAAQLVNSGYKFVYVLDNIDWEEKVHDMRQDVQNKSVHAVATSIVFSRVPNIVLPDDGPQQDLKSCNVNQLVKISEAEISQIKSRYKTIVARLLFEHFPPFAMFQSYVPQQTDCLYTKEMSIKSDVITMPILMKDEKKYSQCVDVLDELEKWTYEIYSAAGLCDDAPTDNVPTATIGCSSRPDQPASHVRPTVCHDDPLQGVRIPCFGDQLTRVRFAGAKDLRAGSHSAKDRLDHLYPFCIVDWYTKRSFLKVTYTE